MHKAEMIMMKNMNRLIAVVLVLASLLVLAGCKKEEGSTVDGFALAQVMLEQIPFDTEITDVGADAALYVSGLPEGAAVRLYMGSAYYSDALVVIQVQDEDHMEDAEAALNNYIAQVRNQYVSYLPDQVDKIDNAVIWKQSPYLVACICPDAKAAQSLADNAAEVTKDVQVDAPSAEQDQPAPSDDEQDEPADEPQPSEEDPVVSEVVEYPTINSQSGTYSTYGTVAYRVDDMAYEIYMYDKFAAENYTSIVNSAAQALEGTSDVYVMAIPTSIGVVFPDDIKEQIEDWSDVPKRVQDVYAMLNDNVTTVDCIGNLLQHRDEYLYFRTDTHWTALGAYYSYEAFCEAKGVEPYTLDQRQHTQFDNFLGVLYYEVSGQDDNLRADVVDAYYPYSDRVSMVFTDRDGVDHDWQVITDVSSWNSSAKYNTFGGGDNPITVYNNPNVSNVKVGLLIKESFGNALIPYLVDHYTVLYEIDYRYWDGNIVEFAKENGVDDVIFANNMGMIRSSLLVGMLADNF